MAPNKPAALYENKRLFVTGGTGSFGQAFIYNALKQSPAEIVIFSRDESKQYDMAKRFDSARCRFVLGDVRDVDAVTQAMAGADYVIHAAALKHIPIAEENPLECIKTNINGSQNIIAAALANAVPKVIALSTDKAVSPINLYGATKLVADKLFIAANRGALKTQFSIVRYGNVIGSRGSVIPLYVDMMSKGAHALPVTDARMTRFWITMADGIALVDKSFLRMKGGEVFVPKIPSAKIEDIAQAMAGAVEYIGIRPGEKLHETLCPADMAHLVLSFADHYVIQPELSLRDGKVYMCNALGEVGTPVSEDFHYTSADNPDFYAPQDINDMINAVKEKVGA